MRSAAAGLVLLPLRTIEQQSIPAHPAYNAIMAVTAARATAEENAREAERAAEAEAAARAAADTNAAIAKIRELQPGVVLVDVHMPGGGGVTVISSVLQTHPETRFLALSVSDSPEDVIAMIRAGARGYVTKSIAPADLADAVRRAALPLRSRWRC